MREMLFRGIIKSDNSRYKRGQWAVGDLVCLQDGNEGKPHIYGCGEVFAPTVGQYAGLTDKNGKKIFEGDIAKVKLQIPYLPSQPKMISAVGVVKFNTEKSCYYVVSTSGEEYALCFIDEVIGNIHDNPELLKESNNG